MITAATIAHMPLWKLEQLLEQQSRIVDRATLNLHNARGDLEQLERHISIRRGERRGKADIPKEQRYG